MNNYEYIIACLPVLPSNAQPGGDIDADEILAFISGQLNSSDRKLFEQLCDGFDPDKLDESFYSKAISSHNSFISKFFEYDLQLRNLKVLYLNRMLSREPDKDLIMLPSLKDKEFEAASEITATLEGSDILARERGLDNLLWNTIEDLSLYELFNINVILAFVARLKIVDRWQKLDPQTGKVFLRKLVDSIRTTYDNKKRNII